MLKPKSDEAGVLLTLYVMAAAGLGMVVVVVGSLWPNIKALFS